MYKFPEKLALLKKTALPSRKFRQLVILPNLLAVNFEASARTVVSAQH
jgi:hypothetical protein